MQYATVQDLIDRFGEPEMIQLTDPEIMAVQASKVQCTVKSRDKACVNRPLSASS